MEEVSSPTSPGGYIPHSILSPPQSSLASTSTAHIALPQPRSQPLKAGGAKESAFIRFVDQGVLQIQRKYAKRGSHKLDKLEDEGEEAKGYESFGEAARDIDRLIDLIWVSGTRMLYSCWSLTMALIANIL
jgi:hypothetical protein